MQASLARALREGLLPAHWRMLIASGGIHRIGLGLAAIVTARRRPHLASAGDVRLAAGNALLELIDGTTQLP